MPNTRKRVKFMLVKNECLSRRQPKFSQAKGGPLVYPDDMFNVAKELFQPLRGRTAINSARQIPSQHLTRRQFTLSSVPVCLIFRRLSTERPSGVTVPTSFPCKRVPIWVWVAIFQRVISEACP